MKLTFEEARFLFTYIPETGKLVWNINRRRARRGNEAGTIDQSNGYLVVTANYQKYSVHELVWLLVHGSYATTYIDHEDRDQRNNRITNLRLRSARGNKINCEASDKAVGCYWQEGTQNWRVAVRYNGTLHNYGSFDTLLDARAEYLKRRRAFADN
jgi:hypothetical protein